MVPLFPFSPSSGIDGTAISIKWQAPMAEYFARTGGDLETGGVTSIEQYYHAE
jgi:hypothetical protein